MSLTRSGYKELGLDLVEPFQDQPRKPRRTPMGDEKKDEGARDPIKILLEEALEKQRKSRPTLIPLIQILCRNVTEYRNNHEHRDVVEITLHFINIKELKFAYRQNGNKTS